MPNYWVVVFSFFFCLLEWFCWGLAPSAKGIILSHLRARLKAAIYDYRSNIQFAGSRPPLGGWGAQGYREPLLGVGVWIVLMESVDDIDPGNKTWLNLNFALIVLPFPSLSPPMQASPRLWTSQTLRLARPSRSGPWCTLDFGLILTCLSIMPPCTHTRRTLNKGPLSPI